MLIQKRFFRDYLPSLPLIDPSLSPNEYHKLSDFLFWVIVFVGSRRYSQDPTLLDRLRPHMNAMALLALQSRDGPFETIKGLLLLCFWPIPMNTIHKDISVILSGAAFHLAMQTGLHLSGSGQDFARTKLDHSRASSVDRTRLWIYCLFVYHRYVWHVRRRFSKRKDGLMDPQYKRSGGIRSRCSSGSQSYQLGRFIL